MIEYFTAHGTQFKTIVSVLDLFLCYYSIMDNQDGFDNTRTYQAICLLSWFIIFITHPSFGTAIK